MPSPGVARNTGLALLTQLVTAAFTAALTLFLVRRLGPADYGVFSLALGLAALLMLPADFGIAQSAGRFIAEHRDDAAALARILGAATRLKVLTGGLVAVALFALAGPIADAYGEPRLEWPLRGMALALFGQSLLTLYLQAFISLGRLGTNLRLVAGESALEASASVALVLVAGGASAAAFGRAVGYAGGALLAIVLVRRAFGGGAVSLRKIEGAVPIARYAGVMLVVNGTYSLFSQMDVLLIGALLSTSAVGQFSAPARLTFLLHYPGLALSNAVSPRMAARPGHEPDVATFRLALRLLIIVQAAMVAPVLVWATPIVELLLGDEYSKSDDVLRAMTPFIVFQGVGPLLAVSVNYLGEARRRVPIAVGALVVNVAINLALLREIGVVAGAIATSAAWLVYVGGHLVICHQLLDLRPRAMALTFARSLLAAAAMAGVLLAFGTSDVSVPALVAGLLAGLLAYAGVLFAARELTRADLAAFRGMWPPRRPGTL
jgi:O-antigen/teichoic acid export membrane protein